MSMELIIAILGGSAVAALINQVGEVIRAKQKQDYKNEDKEDDRIKELREEIDSIKEGLRYILLDRIRHVGQQYIKDGKVDFDDRRILNLMHGVYHTSLDGNGDLDDLMRDVNELPLK